jgi:hypothetical protein
MSEQHPTSDNDSQLNFITSLNVFPATEAYIGEPIPPFRPFPARARGSAPTGDHSHGGPSSGYAATQRDPPLDANSGSSYHMQAMDDGSIRRGSARTDVTQRQRTSTLPALPAFTPFPAARQSRYAAPPGSRTEYGQPVLPSVFTQEPSGGSRLAIPPMELPVGGSTSAVRAPR